MDFQLPGASHEEAIIVAQTWQYFARTIGVAAALS
jgi:hypothetical protein